MNNWSSMPCVNVTTFLECSCLPKNFIFSEFFLRGDPPVAGGRSDSGGNSPVLTRQGFGSVARKLVFSLIGILHPLVLPHRVVFGKIPNNQPDKVPFLTNAHEITAMRTTTTPLGSVEPHRKE